MINFENVKKMTEKPNVKFDRVTGSFQKPKAATMRTVTIALKQFKEVSRKRLVKFSGISAPTLDRAMKVLIMEDRASMREYNNGKQIEYMYSYKTHS